MHPNPIYDLTVETFLGFDPLAPEAGPQRPAAGLPVPRAATDTTNALPVQQGVAGC